MPLKETIQEELDRLKTLVDEVELKAHLAKADAKDELDAWRDKAADARHRLEAELERLRSETEEPIEDISASAKKLAAEVKTGYQKVRDLLRS